MEHGARYFVGLGKAYTHPTDYGPRQRNADPSYTLNMLKTRLQRAMTQRVFPTR